MAFENILSVSGKPGLYKLVGQMKNGIIVESLDDGKRFPVYGSAKVSALEEISIYTEDEEVPLREVFLKMHGITNGKEALSHKEDKDKVKEFFSQVLPDYDPDRVYVSDMIKVVKWFNSLMTNDSFDPEDLKEKAEDSDSSDEGKSSDSKVAKSTAPKVPKMTANKSAKGSASSAKGASRKSGGSQRGG
ncbi:MAG: DUF5606 domain-containing protein [Flavobacteriales bacterium]|nr:DUF5606 domain-containing protein [Flavobacteriales bacterium]MBT7686948.1 DUF5606 domain-containing protein [Flavobacteriales bacterium]MBT7750378.1 DUF5606 domain-containing protein [Flavobacteriales bacterium]